MICTNTTSRLATVALAGAALALVATGASAFSGAVATTGGISAAASSTIAGQEVVQVQRYRRQYRRRSAAETDPRFIDDRTNPNVVFAPDGRRRSCPGLNGGQHFQDRPCWAQFAFDERGDRRRR